MTKSNTQARSKVYHLTEQHSGMTLAAALKDLVEGSSWSQAKKWIGKRYVQVNGNLCLDEARRVSATDVVKLFAQPLAKPIEKDDIKIVHLDDHILVVEKPSGVTSVRHAAERTISTRRRQLQPTLEELLPPALAKLQKLRWPPLPPKGMNRGRYQTNLKRRNNKSQQVQNAKKLPPLLKVFPVHRLDRDTSGLMLFARTRDAEQRLVGMFRRHTVSREYVAFCHGEIQPQKITSKLVRDRGDGLRGSLPADASDELISSAVEAVTHLVSSDPICEDGGPTGYWRIRCKLETGRTHQIRIHLSEAARPLCGEKTYCRLLDGTALEDTSGAPRQALHSDRLEFTHPFTGKHMRFSMQLPKDLTSWLKRLKKVQPDA